MWYDPEDEEEETPASTPAQVVAPSPALSVTARVWQQGLPPLDPLDDDLPSSPKNREALLERCEQLWARGLAAKQAGLDYATPVHSAQGATLQTYYEVDASGGSSLGFGAFSMMVQRGAHKATKTDVAIKAVSRDDGRFLLERGVASELLRLSEEHAHPNVVRYLDVLATGSTLYEVMEPLEGPELFDVLGSGPPEDQFCQRVLRHALAGLAHVHAAGLVHRDVKPENFRFRSPRPDAPLVLIDFGFCVPVEPRQDPKDVVGTRLYSAPELFVPRPCYGTEVDVFSLGVMLYAMLCGRAPLGEQRSARSPHAAGSALPQALQHPYLTPQSRDLLARLLCVEPSQRATCDQALGHPWLTGATAPAPPEPLKALRPAPAPLDLSCERCACLAQDLQPEVSVA